MTTLYVLGSIFILHYAMFGLRQLHTAFNAVRAHKAFLEHGNK